MSRMRRDVSIRPRVLSAMRGGGRSRRRTPSGKALARDAIAVRQRVPSTRRAESPNSGRVAKILKVRSEQMELVDFVFDTRAARAVRALNKGSAAFEIVRRTTGQIATVNALSTSIAAVGTAIATGDLIRRLSRLSYAARS